MNTVEGNKIETGNRLIAEFMGGKISEDGICYTVIDSDEFDGPFNHYYGPPEYHTSWDWLMPVLEKITKHVIKGVSPFNSDQFVRVEIVPNGYVQISNLRDQPIFTNVSVEGSLINAVWKAAIQFIEWYNKNQTK